MNLKRTFIAAIGAAAIAVGGIGLASAQDTTIEVQFQAGTTGATYTGRLGSGGANRYILNAREGQFLTVSLRPDNAITQYILYAPDGSIMHESTQAGLEYYGQLWQSGDHEIEVFYNGNEGTFSNFDIVFEVSALPQGATTTGGNADEQACLAAVAAETGNTVALMGTETAEANTTIMIGVGPQMAPWRCLISRGVVQEVMFMGNEGGL